MVDKKRQAAPVRGSKAKIQQAKAKFQTTTKNKTKKKKAVAKAKEQPRIRIPIVALPRTNEILNKITREEAKARRKHLDERLKVLHNRAMMIEDELKQLEDGRFYRVAIFGSARMKPDTEPYTEVFALAQMLAWEGIDILTGGGPGLMEAANKGAKLGQQEKHSKTKSFGLPIELEWEPAPNLHLDIARKHYKFSNRLDDFMRLCNSIVCTPGGIGTLLELFFSWQLVQVHHLSERPIVLLGKEFWSGLIDWMKAVPLERSLVSIENFDFVHVVDTPQEAWEIVSRHHKEYRLAQKKALAK